MGGADTFLATAQPVPESATRPMQSSDNSEGYLPSLRSAAATLRVEVTEAPVRDDGEIERVITAMSERPGGGLTVMADVFMAAPRADHRACRPPSPAGHVPPDASM